MKKKRTAKGKHHRTKGRTERERKRGRKSGNQGNHLDIEPPLPLPPVGCEMKSEIDAVLRSSSFPSFPPPFQQCLISGTAFSALATGLSVTRLVPQASCLMPYAMCLACHVPQPSHTLLQAVCLIWFWLLYFAAALFFFRFPLFLFFAVLFPFAIDVPVAESPALSLLLLLLLLCSGNFFSAVVCILIRQKAARTVTGSTANTFVCHLCVCLYCVCTFVHPFDARPKPQYDNG